MPDTNLFPKNIAQPESWFVEGSIGLFCFANTR